MVASLWLPQPRRGEHRNHSVIASLGCIQALCGLAATCGESTQIRGRNSHIAQTPLDNLRGTARQTAQTSIKQANRSAGIGQHHKLSGVKHVTEEKHACVPTEPVTA